MLSISITPPGNTIQHFTSEGDRPYNFYFLECPRYFLVAFLVTLFFLFCVFSRYTPLSLSMPPPWQSFGPVCFLFKNTILSLTSISLLLLSHCLQMKTVCSVVSSPCPQSKNITFYVFPILFA